MVLCYSKELRIILFLNWSLFGAGSACFILRLKVGNIRVDVLILEIREFCLYILEDKFGFRNFCKIFKILQISLNFVNH